MCKLIDLFPETKKIIDSAEPKPTIEERVEALETMILEQMLGGLEDV